MSAAPKRITASAAAIALFALCPSAAPASPLRVTWMRGAAPAGTPARYDRVGVLKIGPSSARNVLVLEPGTSAGGTYFVPPARSIVSKVPGWQVWSVERGENLPKDQSVFDLAKAGKASPQAVFDYYLRGGSRTDVSPVTFG